MTAFMEEVLLDTLIDFAKLLPFLFLTYLFMEFLEHRAEEPMKNAIIRSGKIGPLFGGALGAVPQCGFSAAASGLYAGRVITLGTLLAVYLSTSDEMLPVLIANRASPLLVLKLLAIKVVLGILFGFAADLLFSASGSRKNQPEREIHDLCEEEHCHCEEKGIIHSSLHHTLHISFFLLLIMLLLNAAVFFAGEESLSLIFSRVPFIGHLTAGLIGLIPNCASSVLLTQLYLDGVLSAGTMLSGLLAGAGVGVLVLFRMNKHPKENLCIVALLYAVGTVSGFLFDLLQLGTLLRL